MKLLNKSFLYLSVSLLFIVSLWMMVLYFNIYREIKESVDEGLENYKRQIIFQATKDTTVLQQHSFDEGFFAIHEIEKNIASDRKDSYVDTLLYMQDADDEAPELEPTRMLTTMFEQGGRYYELQIINSMVEEDDLMKETFREAIGLYIVLILSVIFINNVVLKKLWKPFYSLLQQLKQYRIGASTSLPRAETKTKEFEDLQNAVHILLQHNTETYEQQKQFIGNASHELQTPLAITKNKLELLLEKGSLKDDDAAQLEDVMYIIDRLVRINKALLLLTKIENKQFFDNKSVNINDLVNLVIDNLDDFAQYRNIEIQLHENAILTVEMDISLANVVISNLLRNAIFHNLQGGIVTIDIQSECLTITNTGGTTSIPKEQLFTRFHKSDSATNGTGLGLAIVKAICSLYGFEIEYKHQNEIHIFVWTVK